VFFKYITTNGGPELFMLLTIFVVTPILKRLYLNRFDRRRRYRSIAAIWGVAFLIVYGDVLVTAFVAQHLCTKVAGLHVYQTVPDRSFIGALSIGSLRERGIEFVEHESPAKIRKYRTRIQDGTEVTEEVGEFLSRVEYMEESRVLVLPIVQSNEKLVMRPTGQTLGEIIGFKLYPGWIDRKVIGSVGFTWTPSRCDGPGPVRPGQRSLWEEDLVAAVMAK
jgi:hypothetical protein